MTLSNFANPLETVQIISIFTYLNTLSEFLFTENLLEENDLNQKLPVVNALYKYFALHEHEPEKAKRLARKLLKASDLYGEKNNENIDTNFVNIMFDYIISSFVFEKFGNIYGFLAQVIRSSENITINFLINNFKTTLQNLTFENENGDDFVLTPLSVHCIFVDLILPLFPIPKENLTIISIDFIYAQAGLMFFQSNRIKSTYFRQSNVSENSVINSNKRFDEFIGVAHIIENLVHVGKLEKIALSIFSLPALFHYVYKEKESLRNKTIQNIITDPNQWSRAYHLLFFYTNSMFKQIEKTHLSDYRYQLHSALASFKNHDILAKDKIITMCSNTDKDNINDLVDQYRTTPKSYRCNRGNKVITLPDLNKLYDKQINEIRNKYFQFEKESIREAFGDLFAEPISKYIIVKGSFENEEIKPSDDLLQFYFTGFRGFLFYALIRKDYNITLISEKDNPMFRQTLGVSDNATFATNDFSNPLKRFNQNFEYFLTNMAEKRAQLFENHLHSLEFESKHKDWWKDFGLSLIPYHSCLSDAFKGNVGKMLIDCPIDSIFFFPVAGELKTIVSKMTNKATQRLYSALGTTLNSIGLRQVVKRILNVGKNVVEMVTDTSGDKFHELGHALIRLTNVELELDFIINTEGLTTIMNVISNLQMVSNRFKSVVQMLGRTKNVLALYVLGIGIKFGRTVYVKSLDQDRNSGYGYKLINLSNDTVAQVRHIGEMEDEVLMVFYGVSKNNEKIYRKEELKNLNAIQLYVEIDGLLTKLPEVIPIEIRLPIYNDGKCYERKSNNYCDRTPILVKVAQFEESAVNYMINYGMFQKLEILEILRKFYFPVESNKALEFVKEWMANSDKQMPSWIEEYKVDEPDLLYELRFSEFLDSELTEAEAIHRIEKLYSKSDLERIGITPNYMRNIYIESKAYYSARFEDFYAIGNLQGLFGSRAFLRLGDKTDEGRRMRNALYRLAIRQMDDPLIMFPRKLFAIEKRSQQFLDKVFSSEKKFFEFDKFTPAWRNIETAVSFFSGQRGDRKVVYEIQLAGQHLSARVEKLYPLQKSESIILPGTKFDISIVQNMTDEKIGDHFRVILHLNETTTRDVQNVMTTLKKLKTSKTEFYYNEPSYV